MRQLWASVKGFFGRDWTPAEKTLVIICCILIGVVQGFFLAPIKKGINWGNNSRNKVYGSLDEEYWIDDED